MELLLYIRSKEFLFLFYVQGEYVSIDYVVIIMTWNINENKFTINILKLNSIKFIFMICYVRWFCEAWIAIRRVHSVLSKQLAVYYYGEINHHI